MTVGPWEKNTVGGGGGDCSYYHRMETAIRRRLKMWLLFILAVMCETLAQRGLFYSDISQPFSRLTQDNANVSSSSLLPSLAGTNNFRQDFGPNPSSVTTKDTRIVIPQEGTGEWHLPFRDKMVRIEKLHTNNHCLWTKNSNGWGNAVMAVVAGALRLVRRDSKSKEAQLPCIMDYEYGGVFSKLFRNLPQCPWDPNRYNEDVCLRLMEGDKESSPWHKARAMIEARRWDFPEVFQLDQEYIEKTVFANNPIAQNLTIAQFQTSTCAVQARFGDAFFRNNTKQTHVDNRRLCEERHLSSTTQGCFDHVTKKLLQRCPDPKLSMYISSDLPQFKAHFCEATDPQGHRKKHIARSSRRVVLSSCREEKGQHSKDVKLVSRKGVKPEPTPRGQAFLYRLMTDWLALVFAKENIQRRRAKILIENGTTAVLLEPTPAIAYGSTFVETADYHYHI